MVCVVAVFVVGLGLLSGIGGRTDGRMSGFASMAETETDVTGVVESIGTTRSGRPAVTLCLCGDGFEGEKTVVYMKDSSCRAVMQPGDTLTVEVRVKRVENFVEGFDYVEYMAGKGIFFICFQRGVWSVCSAQRPEIRYRVRRARNHCIAALRRIMAPLKPENSALLVAFLTGDRENIGNDVLEDFRNSGMMHTLALSGLHVGIIYSLLAFVFSILGNYPASHKVRSVIVILALWPYALLTGMGTSIFRAVVMATVYEAAVILERERSPLNTLAVSAVIVTLADPSSPSTISFQLSFGAMLGIALFFRPLSSLVSDKVLRSEVLELESVLGKEHLPDHQGVQEGEWVKNFRVSRFRGVSVFGRILLRWRKRIWDLCALSLSCQMVTAPIVWFMFGTFPVWSMLANVLCTPLVGGSMMLAPVCAVLSGVPYVGEVAFFLLDLALDALRFCVGVMGTS